MTGKRASGPPAIPRCGECQRIVSHQGHSKDCQRGQEQARHFANVEAVRTALKAAIDARRQDRKFMERLAACLAADKNILDRMGSDDG